MAIIECNSLDGTYCKVYEKSISEIEKENDFKCLKNCINQTTVYSGKDRDDMLLKYYRSYKGRTDTDEIRFDAFYAGHCAHHPDDELAIWYDAIQIKLICLDAYDGMSSHTFLDSVNEMKRLGFAIPRRIRRVYRRINNNSEKYEHYLMFLRVKRRYKYFKIHNRKSRKPCLLNNTE